jgi:hypothetical protein
MRLILAALIFSLVGCAGYQPTQTNLDENQMAVYVNSNYKRVTAFTQDEYNFHITAFRAGAGRIKSSEDFLASLLADAMVDGIQNNLSQMWAEGNISELHPFVRSGELKRTIDEALTTFTLKSPGRIVHKFSEFNAFKDEAVGNHILMLDTEFGLSPDFQTPILFIDAKFIEKTTPASKTATVLFEREFAVIGDRFPTPLISQEEALSQINALKAEYQSLSLFEKHKAIKRFNRKLKRLELRQPKPQEIEDKIVQHWSANNQQALRQEFAKLMQEALEHISQVATENMELQHQLTAVQK